MSGKLKRYFLTLNWQLSESVCPVDTERPPISVPLEWGYLADFSDDCRVRDGYFSKQSIASTVDELVEFEPDIILMSTAPSYLFWRCPPLNLELVRRYCEAIKASVGKAKIVLIGPHASSDPAWVLDVTSADSVFLGEPDGNVMSSWIMEDYDACEWLFHRGSTEPATAPQKMFKDGRSVDYRVFFGLSQYRPHAWGTAVQNGIIALAGGGSSVVEYARGCSYDCSFCLRSGFRRNLRFKPIEVFETEIMQLSAMGIKYVFFIDEDFGRPISKYTLAMEVLSQYGMKFGCQARPDAFGPEEINLLSAYGCLYLELGLESLDTTTRSQMGKFEVDHDTSEIVAIAKERIPFAFANVFDPGRVVDVDSLSTVALDNEGNPASPFICYPGTPAGDRVLRAFRVNGIEGTDWDICEAIYVHDSLVSGVRKLEDIPQPRSLDSDVEFVRQFLQLKLNQTKGSRVETRFDEVIDPNR